MTNNKNSPKKLLFSTATITLVLLAQFIFPFITGRAAAASLTYGMVRLNRMNASQATTGTVCARTNATVQTEAAVGVTFPTGYTVSTTLSNWAIDVGTTTSWPKDPNDGTTTATAWPSIAQPSAGQIVGQIVVFGSGDLAINTWYCFNWTNTASVSVKSSATNDNIGIITTCNANTTACAGLSTSGANLDTKNWATSSVAASCSSVGCDQIAVTASVNASFSFSLASNTAALSALSAAGPTAATAINASVSTNATKGWNIWAADPAGTPGLTSTAVTKTIAYSPTVGSTAATLSTGVEGFNLGVDASAGGTCGGSTTIDPNFNRASTPFKGGGLDNTPRSVAVGTGASSACLIPLYVNASISNITPAATDYAATMTVIAAGRF